MSTEPKTIKVTEDTELIPLLEQARLSPLLLERDGVVYRLGAAEEDGNIPAIKDPEAIQKVLDETIGSWADIDTDALIADIYRWREEGSRPIDRP